MGRIEVLTGPERRRRWSEDVKARIVSEAMAPGAVVVSMARRHDILPQRIYRWRRDLEPEGAPGFAGFLPVEVTDEAAGRGVRSPPAVEIALSCGRTLRVGCDIEGASLGRLIRVVEGA